MEGFGIFTLLLAVLFGILPFIALMCIWSNTGKTASLLDKMWNAQCEIDQRDPASGRLWSAIQAEKDAAARAEAQRVAEKEAKKAAKKKS